VTRAEIGELVMMGSRARSQIFGRRASFGLAREVVHISAILGEAVKPYFVVIDWV